MKKRQENDSSGKFPRCVHLSANPRASKMMLDISLILKLACPYEQMMVYFHEAKGKLCRHEREQEWIATRTSMWFNFFSFFLSRAWS